MRWEVKGVDANSGLERSMNLEAKDEAEATAFGNYNGMLVETVERARPAPVLDYRRNEKKKLETGVVRPAERLLPTVAPPALADGEEAILSILGAFVSNTRIVIGGRTYSVRNVTSVQICGIYPNVLPALLGAVAAAAAAIICAAVGFADIRDTGAIAGGIAGLLIFGAVAAACVYAVRQARVSFALILETAAGSVSAYQHTDRWLIGVIHEAIVRAIASCGME
jgi:hypothetical protein